MEFKYLLLIAVLLSFLSLSAQVDSIIVYNVEQQSVDKLSPVSYDESVLFDKTDWNYGSMPDVATLDLIPSENNLFANTEFSKLVRSESFFNINDYPIRTSVRLFRYNSDTLKGSCSGMLVGENLVLTAAHCVRDYNGMSWKGDSMFIATGYDNGQFHTELPSSSVSKYYIFNSYYSHSSRWSDFALLELKDPIGLKTGWIGMAFSKDRSYYTDNILHKLSYPGDASMFDIPIKVNGDTLYYNYGKVEMLSASSSSFIGLNSDEAKLIPGQSGSSLFYTENTNNYHSVGIAVYSLSYRHFTFSNNVFYQFKNIIENYGYCSSAVTKIKRNVKAYPNPFHHSVTFELSNPNNREYKLDVCNLSGETLNNRSLDFR